ncbi:Capsule biosynthesis protein CapA [Mixta theicola]|nr:CapA family protein [Mixta theicola]QHM74992.1 Capsule biosynthesis protein CapA [Mixta theicola]
MKSNIIIGGDVSFDAVDYNKKGNFQKLKECLNNAEYSIFNLESPITNSENKINKIGPNLKTSTQAGEILLSYLKPDMVTLANNHIKDFGQEGIENTLELCKKLHIDTVGAGKNVHESFQDKTIILSCGVSVTIINACEQEFNLSAPDEYGAAHFNEIDLYYRITAAKRKSHKVITIVHGGHEHYSLPSPGYKKKLHYLIDVGADVVISHHTHFASGYEVKNDAPIFYSLGNLIFNRKGYGDYWHKGYLVNISFDETGRIDFELLPYQQCVTDNDFNFLEGLDKINYLKNIDSINEKIINEVALAKEWGLFMDSQTKPYYMWLNQMNKPERIFYRLFPQRALSNYKKRKLARLWQLLSCESHRELSIKLLEKYIK